MRLSILDLLHSLENSNQADCQLDISYESHHSISKDKIIEYTKDYLSYDEERNRFTHHISAINTKYHIAIKSGTSFFRKFSILFHIDSHCKYCGISSHKLSIPSRTDLKKYISNPTKSFPIICSICSHETEKSERNLCHCSGCKEERQKQLIDRRKNSFQTFNAIREKINSTVAPPLSELEANFDKLNLLNTWTKFSSGNIAQINSSIIVELLKLGFLKLSELKFEEFIQNKFYLFIESRDSSTSDLFSKRIINFLEINEDNVSSFVDSFISELTREDSPYTNQVHKMLAPEDRIIREFTIAIAEKHGLNFSDLTDKTVNNLVLLLDVMSIYEALAAIRTSLRSATGWCTEKSVTGIHKRNIAVSFLNQLYQKYRFEGWQKPFRPLEDWELEETYGISSSLYTEFNPILENYKSINHQALQQEFYNLIYRP